LLKYADFIIGNSSAGVREAPYYGIPTINIGTRQDNRAVLNSIINTNYTKDAIVEAILKDKIKQPKALDVFGNGKSADAFIHSLKLDRFWEVNHQKQFRAI
jgi:UDP-N-acetylglucosamine 2-epimerase (hydrolysing)